MKINFSGRHHPSDITILALLYYLAYKLSCWVPDDWLDNRSHRLVKSTRWMEDFINQLQEQLREH